MTVGGLRWVMRITLLGAGSMGGALCFPLADRQHDLRLWTTEYDAEILETTRAGQPHPQLGFTLPSGVQAYGPEALAEAIDATELVILATNTAGALPVMRKAAPLLPPGVPLLTLAKGFLKVEGAPVLIGQGVERVLKDSAKNPGPIHALVGPSIAKELARRQRTAVMLAGEKGVAELAAQLSADYFFVHPSPDFMSVELCASFKNTYSIGLAWASGLGEREKLSYKNLEAILFVQTLKELGSIVEALGGNPAVVSGLAGAGDFIATADAGRNGTLGRLLGTGKHIEEAQGELHEKGIGTIEGLNAAPLASAFLQKHFDDLPRSLPLFSAIARVLCGEQTVDESLVHLPFLKAQA